MAILQFFLFAYFLHEVVNSQCKWSVMVPGGAEFTLDLSCAAGRELVTTDQDGSHNFLYSICSNGETCNGSPVMTKETLLVDPNTCYVIGRWDQNIQPVYGSENGGRWIFEYANGANDCGNPARTWAPTFQCDSVEWAIDTVQEPGSNCYYTVTIHTKYACTGNTDCSNHTTTTIPPVEECIWTIGDNILNLTSIKGFTLNGISDNDAQQIYSLTPCSNKIDCNGNFSMTTISTLSNCIATIVRWDGGLIEPTHSNNFGGQWEFVYTNGDECVNGAESVVTLFWNCNPFAGTGTITAAKEVGTCIFEIHIDSNLACS